MSSHFFVRVFITCFVVYSLASSTIIGTEFFRLFIEYKIIRKRMNALQDTDLMLRLLETFYENELVDGKGVDRGQFLAVMAFHFYKLDYNQDIAPWLLVRRSTASCVLFYYCCGVFYRIICSSLFVAIVVDAIYSSCL